MTLQTSALCVGAKPWRLFLHLKMRCIIMSVLLRVQWSLELADMFVEPLVISHPRGHVIPALADEPLATLRAFLSACAAESSL